MLGKERGINVRYASFPQTNSTILNRKRPRLGECHEDEFDAWKIVASTREVYHFPSNIILLLVEIILDSHLVENSSTPTPLAFLCIKIRQDNSFSVRPLFGCKAEFEG